jgi:hypothetical protein
VSAEGWEVVARGDLREGDVVRQVTEAKWCEALNGGFTLPIETSYLRRAPQEDYAGFADESLTMAREASGAEQVADLTRWRDQLAEMLNDELEQNARLQAERDALAARLDRIWKRVTARPEKQDRPDEFGRGWYAALRAIRYDRAAFPQEAQEGQQ